MILNANKMRGALVMFGWTSSTLAIQALLCFDEVAKAQDDIDIRGGCSAVKTMDQPL